MKNAVVYARYSSERQTEQSIEGQLRVCEQYALQNGLKIVDTYIDRAVTGTNDNRAAFQQMLADSAKPVSWEIVLIYAIDRFGRNSIEIAVNKQKLHKNKKTLISATQRTSENIDGSKNLDGILLENMYIGLAEYYSAELSQKVKRGIHENRLKGFTNGGKMIFGYKLVNKRVAVDEDKVPIVLKIFQDYALGIDGQTIINDLNKRGILNGDRPFYLTTFLKLLRNKKYIGIAEFSDGVYDNIYPAIVPKDLFEEVQFVLSKNRGGKSIKAPYLLRNRCTCGYCGKVIQGETGTARDGSVRRYYKCAGRKNREGCNKQTVPKAKLENFILDITHQVLGSKENIEKIADAIIEISYAKRGNLNLVKILSDEKEELQNALNNVMKAIEQGIITPTTKKRVEELENQISELNIKIGAELYKEQNALTREQIIEYITHCMSYSSELMATSLIENVKLYDDKVEILYKYCLCMPKDPTEPDEYHRVPLNYTGSNRVIGGQPKSSMSFCSYYFFHLRICNGT